MDDVLSMNRSNTVNVQAIVCVIWFLLCASETLAQTTKPIASLPSLPPSSLMGLDPSLIDRSVSPSSDFYSFANGLWIKRHTIPADRTEWGIFGEAEQRNLIVLHSILNDAERGVPGDPNEAHCVHIVGAFYRSGMDTTAIDEEGDKPLAPELDRIAAIDSVAQLMDEIAYQHRVGAVPAFSFFVGADDKNSSNQIPQLYQSGIGLPDRDYYFRTDTDSRRIRSEYVEHVRRMFVLMGESQDGAKRDSETVMRLETRLAAASMTQDEQRDPSAIYHSMSLRQIDALTPGVDWYGYFKAIGLPNPNSPMYNVSQPKFFRELGRMISSRKAVSWSDWRTYLRWQLIDAAAPYLSRQFETEDFAFNDTILEGDATMRPRWERVESVID